MNAKNHKCHIYNAFFLESFLPTFAFILMNIARSATCHHRSSRDSDPSLRFRKIGIGMSVLYLIVAFLELAAAFHRAAMP